ncbi:hypothetical protein [Pedobacter sp. NJ-S-72]
MAQNKISTLPIWKKAEESVKKQDWLINSSGKNARIYRSTDSKDIIFSNGLVKRSFRLQPNLACTDFSNLSNNQQLIRAVSPEAKLTIDGKTYNVGGLHGQKNKKLIFYIAGLTD